MSTYPAGIQYVNVLEGVAASVALQGFNSPFSVGQLLGGPLSYRGEGAQSGSLLGDYPAWARTAVTVTEGTKNGVASVYVNYTGGSIASMTPIQLGGVVVSERPWFADDGTHRGAYYDAGISGESHTLLFVPNFKVSSSAFTTSLTDNNSDATWTYTFDKPLNPNQTSRLGVTITTGMFGGTRTLSYSNKVNSQNQLTGFDVIIPFGSADPSGYGTVAIHVKVTETLTYLKGDTLTTEQVTHTDADCSLTLARGNAVNGLSISSANLPATGGTLAARVTDGTSGTGYRAMYGGTVAVSYVVADSTGSLSSWELWATPEGGTSVRVSSGSCSGYSASGSASFDTRAVVPSGCIPYTLTLKVFDTYGHTASGTVSAPNSDPTTVYLANAGFSSSIDGQGAVPNAVAPWWPSTYSIAKPIAGHWVTFSGTYTGANPYGWACLVDAASFVSKVKFELLNNSGVTIRTSEVTTPTDGNLTGAVEKYNQIKGCYQAGTVLYNTYGTYSIKVTITDAAGVTKSNTWAVNSTSNELVSPFESIIEFVPANNYVTPAASSTSAQGYAPAGVYVSAVLHRASDNASIATLEMAPAAPSSAVRASVPPGDYYVVTGGSWTRITGTPGGTQLTETWASAAGLPTGNFSVSAGDHHYVNVSYTT